MRVRFNVWVIIALFLVVFGASSQMHAFTLLEKGLLSQELISLSHLNKKQVSLSNLDLFGLGMPYNELGLKIGGGKSAILLQISELKNEIDIPYQLRELKLTTTRNINSQFTLGAKLNMKQTETVIKGSEYALDVGLGWQMAPMVALAVGVQDILVKSNFSAGSAAQVQMQLNSSLRVDLGSNFAFLCSSDSSDILLGLEQRLGEKVLIAIGGSQSSLEGGFYLSQGWMGIGYEMLVHQLGVQQKIIFTLNF